MRFHERTQAFLMEKHMNSVASVIADEDAEESTLPLRVLKSAAGYYIGTADEEGPVSRISGYWPEQSAAQSALDKLTGRSSS